MITIIAVSKNYEDHVRAEKKLAGVAGFSARI
jgi:hypothetical protein